MTTKEKIIALKIFYLLFSIIVCTIIAITSTQLFTVITSFIAAVTNFLLLTTKT